MSILPPWPPAHLGQSAGVPAVSFLIPSHRPTYLAETLASVFAQTDPDYQVLVDYLPGPLDERLNRMAESARGEWLCILCDDDLLEPGFLAATARARAEGADIIYTDATEFYPDGRTMRARMRPFTLENFREGPPTWITALVRRSLWLAVGGHDTRMAYHDWDHYYRCFLHGASTVHIPEALWRYRRHESQWGTRVDPSAARAEFFSRHPELAP